jgi:hypothetical protein
MSSGRNARIAQYPSTTNPEVIPLGRIWATIRHDMVSHGGTVKSDSTLGGSYRLTILNSWPLVGGARESCVQETRKKSSRDARALRRLTRGGIACYSRQLRLQGGSTRGSRHLEASGSTGGVMELMTLREFGIWASAVCLSRLESQRSRAQRPGLNFLSRKGKSEPTQSSDMYRPVMVWA